MRSQWRPAAKARRRHCERRQLQYLKPRPISQILIRIHHLFSEIKILLRGKDVTTREHRLQTLDPISACKSQTLLPLGIKVGCETCGYVGDHPEDG
jgi:hypothetical protein